MQKFWSHIFGNLKYEKLNLTIGILCRVLKCVALINIFFIFLVLTLFYEWKLWVEFNVQIFAKFRASFMKLCIKGLVLFSCQSQMLPFSVAMGVRIFFLYHFTDHVEHFIVCVISQPLESWVSLLCSKKLMFLAFARSIFTSCSWSHACKIIPTRFSLHLLEGLTAYSFMPIAWFFNCKSNGDKPCVWWVDFILHHRQAWAYFKVFIFSPAMGYGHYNISCPHTDFHVISIWGWHKRAMLFPYISI